MPLHFLSTYSCVKKYSSLCYAFLPICKYVSHIHCWFLCPYCTVLESSLSSVEAFVCFFLIFNSFMVLGTKLCIREIAGKLFVFKVQLALVVLQVHVMHNWSGSGLENCYNCAIQ